MSIAARLRAAPAIALAASIVYGCSTPVWQAGQCVDITGAYGDQSQPPGQSLAALLFAAHEQPASAGTVRIAGDANGQLKVADAKGRSAVLARDRDYVCTAQGLRLTRDTVGQIALPPLVTESKTTHYTFTRQANGSLVLTTTVTTRLISYGIPMTGPEQADSVFRWRPAGQPR